MISSPIQGTSPNSPKMSWWQYWYGHCWLTGWKTIGEAFINWSDLMTSNYKNYCLLKTDDPEETCAGYFWDILGSDEVYDKEFLECLMQMADDVEKGKVEPIPMDEDFMNRLKDLVDDVENDT